MPRPGLKGVTKSSSQPSPRRRGRINSLGAVQGRHVQGQISLWEYIQKASPEKFPTATAFSQVSGPPNPDPPSQDQPQQDPQAQVEPLTQQILNVQLNERQ